MRLKLSKAQTLLTTVDEPERMQRSLTFRPRIDFSRAGGASVADRAPYGGPAMFRAAWFDRV